MVSSDPKPTLLEEWVVRCNDAAKAGTTVKMTLREWADLTTDTGWQSLWNREDGWAWREHPPWMLFGIEVEFVKPDDRET